MRLPRHVSRHAALTGCFLTLALPLQAQEEDGGGMIQRFLQDKLSTGGREVKIRGFEGLLSGAARLEELTIADADGVWLTLRDAELNWSRAALLRGNLSVETLAAGELIVERLPTPDPDAPTPAKAPKAEASGFSLPELPISIRIDKLAIERTELGEGVIGQHAVLGFNGAVQLADGEGSVTLDTTRLDGRDDHISLQGSFVNESRVLSLNLALEEQAGGIVASALKIPGAPSVVLKLAGDGPLSAFAADLGLSTDGTERLAGNVTLTGDGSGNTGFTADLGGDISALVPTDFHDFFGIDTRLTLEGTKGADGSLDLPHFTLDAQSLALQGALSLGTDGLPTAFDLTGHVGRADGAALRLPVSGPGTWLDALNLKATFDAAESDRWILEAGLSGLKTDSASVERLALDGGGRISPDGGATITAELTLDAAGLTMADPRLADALGEALRAEAGLTWEKGGALNVTRIRAEGADFGAEILGDLRIAGRSLHVSGDGQLRAEDLSRFSTLAGRPLTGQANAKLAGEGDVLGGIFDLTASLTADGVSIGQEMADRLLDGPVTLETAIKRDLTGTELKQFVLRSAGISADASGQVGSGRSDIALNAALSDLGMVLPGREGAVTLSGTARESSPADWQVGLDLAGPYGLAGQVAGRVHAGESDVNLDLSLPDIAPLVPGHEGPLSIAGRAAEAGPGQWNVDLDLGGPYELKAAVAGLIAPGASDITLDIALPDLAPLAPGHSGPVALNGTAREAAGGWRFNLDGTAPYDARVALDGAVGGGPGKVNFTATLPDIAPLAPSLSGALTAEGTAEQAGDGLWQVDVTATGPAATQLSLAGLAGGGQSRLVLDLSVPRVAAFAAGIPGSLEARANAAQRDGGIWDFDVEATGPHASTITAEGSHGAGNTRVALKAGLPDVGALAPSLSGPLSLDGTAARAGAGWDIAFDAGLPYRGSANLSGTLASGATALDLQLEMPSVAPFAPGISGGVTASGTVRQAPGGYAVTLKTDGPQRVSSSTSGTVSEDFRTLALTSRGTALLGLANGILSPRAINGTADFNIAVNGPPALDSVSGQVTVNGGELVLPQLRQSLRDINLRLGLNGATLRVDGTASGPEGGSLGAKGTLQLSGGLNANLETTFNRLVLSDPSLYTTTLQGGLAITGPLAGGADIEGRITLTETEIRLSDGGLGFGGSIPKLRHVGEPRGAYLTRQRAGLTEAETGASKNGGKGKGYGLKITISAPDKVFIRGRGLDTELGGGLSLGGTTTNLKPVGEIRVVRGRLEILGKRLDVTEGSLSLAGGLSPYLDLTASSRADEFEFLAQIKGPVDNPQITLTSVPELPEDEVLARFLFGKSVTDLSPLQAAQMANALATLTGRGGVGLLSNLRGGLGLDDLDLAGTDAGGTEVRAGKYLTDKIYTEFVADSLGGTEINLNIDLTRTVTVKGGASATGSSSIGIYFERDY